MTAIHTIHGLNFSVERDGWRNATADAEQAENNLVDALRALTAEQAAALHSGLKAEMEVGDGPKTQEAMSLCYDAVEPVARNWHDPSAPWLFLGAAE